MQKVRTTGKSILRNSPVKVEFLSRMNLFTCYIGCIYVLSINNETGCWEVTIVRRNSGNKYAKMIIFLTLISFHSNWNFVVSFYMNFVVSFDMNFVVSFYFRFKKNFHQRSRKFLKKNYVISSNLFCILVFNLPLCRSPFLHWMSSMVILNDKAERNWLQMVRCFWHF